jgi:hypothetical protein
VAAGHNLPRGSYCLSDPSISRDLERLIEVKIGFLSQALSLIPMSGSDGLHFFLEWVMRIKRVSSSGVDLDKNVSQPCAWNAPHVGYGMRVGLWFYFWQFRKVHNTGKLINLPSKETVGKKVKLFPTHKKEPNKGEILEYAKSFYKRRATLGLYEVSVVDPFCRRKWTQFVLFFY